MSTASSRSQSRSGTPLGTRPHSTNNTASTSSLSQPPPSSNGASTTNNYFSYPVSRVMSGLYRRLTDPPRDSSQQKPNMSPSSSIYTPKRTASPFQPPPLSPLTLNATSTPNSGHILSRALAEEIRLLVPPRLQLVDAWQLAYSLERDGSSLSTLYDTCRQAAEHNPRAGYVLVVRDASDGGAVFGAYLTDAPHPSSHFYGTGECFLWRASVLASTPVTFSHNTHHNSHNSHHNHNQNEGHEHEEQNNERDNEFHTMTDEELQAAGFPPPPSADTTHAVRSTTLRASTPTRALGSSSSSLVSSDNHLSLPEGSGKNNGSVSGSGTSTPERIRFKAFPYSGINDYMIFCETGFLSVGGGDGHYGLWIDSSVEKGVSASCPTFGNEPLSDEGTKFDILGVEIWYIGS
ncbi:Oxidation resistance protein 1 [Talaromyces atroroseus]|uniref:Oxidation resistance protein 1 n=1 Tax=Talaromyces atroroseus TaxID=1441469 RepID=A0A225APK2_TALAT|nr:Oxidation resistance protein 1 [Talaromyces atroroseus]OKL56886.1 Oxidation resistance protein 1 [Talaromyces atroroseus]